LHKEIERKFLVKNVDWISGITGTEYRQGYFPVLDKAVTLRVRSCGEKAYLTIKGELQGCARDEFEYEVPVPDAELMFKLCVKPLIEKTRYLIKYDQNIWEVDVFSGENSGK